MRRGSLVAVLACAVTVTALLSGAVASAGTTGVRAAVPNAPPGWTLQRQGDLAFALPPGFTARPADAGLAASAQWTKADDRRLPVAPAVAVYVETGQVGPLSVRATEVSRVRTAELGVDPARPVHDVTVPGSAAAVAAEWRWDVALGAGQPAVPSRQVEVVVQTTGSRQYGVMLGGPQHYLTDQVVADFVASLAVVGAGS